MKYLANFISVVFQPILLPTYTALFFLYAFPHLFQAFNSQQLLAIVFAHTFFFPLVAILLMVKLEFVDSIHMHDNKQRIGPLIACIVIYLWHYLTLQKLEMPSIITAFALGMVIALAVSFFINVFYKLSLHMVAISGAFTALTFSIFHLNAQSFVICIPICLLLMGAVAWARFYLKAHTKQQLITGFLVGSAAQLLGIVFGI